MLMRKLVPDQASKQIESFQVWIGLNRLLKYFSLQFKIEIDWRVWEPLIKKGI